MESLIGWTIAQAKQAETLVATIKSHANEVLTSSVLEDIVFGAARLGDQYAKGAVEVPALAWTPAGSSVRSPPAARPRRDQRSRSPAARSRRQRSRSPAARSHWQHSRSPAERSRRYRSRSRERSSRRSRRDSRRKRSASPPPSVGSAESTTELATEHPTLRKEQSSHSGTRSDSQSPSPTLQRKRSRELRLGLKDIPMTELNESSSSFS